MTLKEIFQKQTEQVRKYLGNVEFVSEHDAKRTIAKYTAAIEGNFIPWMSAAVIHSRSLQAEYAAKENLEVELGDDHPGMLRQFSIDAHAEPTLDDYRSVQDAVKSIRNLSREGSGLVAITVIATLENTSAAFIPFLAGLAKKRGSKNLTYTDIHGGADIEHANQFIWALEYEKIHYQYPDPTIDQAIQSTCQFIYSIFKLDK